MRKSEMLATAGAKMSNNITSEPIMVYYNAEESPRANLMRFLSKCGGGSAAQRALLVDLRSGSVLIVTQRAIGFKVRAGLLAANDNDPVPTPAPVEAAA
jgi:hypothetical protein